MLNITAREVAQLGRNRTIPNVFERTWKVRTGINPVAIAMEFARDSIVAAVATLVLTLLLAFVLMWFVAHESMVITPTVFFVLCSLVVIFSVVMSNSPHKKNLEAEVRLFCNDFSAFCDWDGEASREKYADMNDIEIKVIAEEILIDAADRKLDAEEVPANPHDAQKARWIADLASGFNEKRSTLERLGLVSGGYDKFFKKADKRRKENEKTIAA